MYQQPRTDLNKSKKHNQVNRDHCLRPRNSFLGAFTARFRIKLARCRSTLYTARTHEVANKFAVLARLSAVRHEDCVPPVPGIWI